jgi:hypothetical protein
MMPTILWAVIELNLLVICPSMFTLRGFAGKLLPKLFGSTFDASSADKNNNNNKNNGTSIRTFGQSMNGRGRRYNKYGELEDGGTVDFDLQTLGRSEPTEVSVQGGGPRRPRRDNPSTFSQSAADSHERTTSVGDNGSDGGNSEHAIIHTTTYTVEKSNRR